MNIIHISHIDLDGYASQYILSKAFSEQDNITYLNFDYADFYVFLNKKENFNYMSKFDKIFISDLNLKQSYCEELNNLKNIILIDHHNVSFDISVYPWYFLDKSISATYGVYNYFGKNFHLKYFVEYVSDNDLFKRDSLTFKASLALSDTIFNSPLIYTKRELLFYLFDCFVKENFFLKSSLDTEIFILKSIHEYYEEENPSRQKMILSEYNYFVENLKELSIGMFFSNIPLNNFQYLFSKYLDSFEENVLINIDPINSMGSVRTINGKACEVAMKLGGGGHNNMAGFNGKDFDFEKLKEVF